MTEKRIKHLCALLREARDPCFHLAPFAGYICEPHRESFGLVFNVPNQAQNHERTTVAHEQGQTHSTLENEMSRIKWLPLDQRLNIAIAVTRAVFSLHAVSWLHKSHNSSNIVFFSQHGRGEGESMLPAHSTLYDLSNPYIFGFDHSRHENTPSDLRVEFRPDRLLYTHPDRWGQPSEAGIFSREYDIYSVGVILLEIGCWRQAKKLYGRGFKDVVDQYQVRDQLLTVAREQLRHMAGNAYSSPVKACLDGSFPTTSTAEKGAGKNYVEADKTLSGLVIHKAFGKYVLDVLLGIQKAL